MNDVHATAVVEPAVVLGQGNVIGPYAVLQAPLRLGDRNWVGAHAVLGGPGQVRGGAHGPAVPGSASWSDDAWQDGSPGAGISIGSGNVIREHATVHQGTTGETVVGDRCYLMSGSHVPHDAQLADEVTLANCVLLGGHAQVGRGATLGLGAVVHQRVVIGAGAMVGMQAAVSRHVPPYALLTGVPARVRGANQRRLLQLGLSVEAVDRLQHHYAEGGPMPQLSAELAIEWADFERLVAR